MRFEPNDRHDSREAFKGGGFSIHYSKQTELNICSKCGYVGHTYFGLCDVCAFELALKSGRI